MTSSHISNLGLSSHQVGANRSKQCTSQICRESAKLILSDAFLTEEDPEKNEAKKTFIETLSETAEDLEAFAKDQRWVVQLENMVTHLWNHPVLKSILFNDVSDPKTGLCDTVSHCTS